MIFFSLYVDAVRMGFKDHLKSLTNEKEYATTTAYARFEYYENNYHKGCDHKQQLL